MNALLDRASQRLYTLYSFDFSARCLTWWPRFRSIWWFFRCSPHFADVVGSLVSCVSPDEYVKLGEYGKAKDGDGTISDTLCHQGCKALVVVFTVLGIGHF